MVELLQANWILLVIALVLGIIAAWWVFSASRKTKVIVERDEETGETETGPKRNQALIDAPPAAAPPSAKDAAPAPAPEPSPAPTPAPTPAPAADHPSVELAGSPESDTPGQAPAPTPAPAPVSDTVPDAPPPPPPQEPASEPAQAPAGQPAGEDDLTRIKGVGPKLAQMLKDMGITSLSQIAAWDDAEIDRVDAQLGRFQGRIRRDDWPEQARLLSAGDMDGYKQKYGNV